jgi:deoxyribonuclease IV
MAKIGIKLWSTNVDVLEKVRELYECSFFDYIELYCVPGTLMENVKFWKNIKIPMILHAPHSGHSFNLSDGGCFSRNVRIFENVLFFSDSLTANEIIVHGGNGGKSSETIRQIKIFNDPRVIIENKPALGLNGKECIGFTPESIVEIIEECGLSGFVLDFNHAVCAARYLGENPMDFIGRFNNNKPLMFHMSDGDYLSSVDTHMHLGQGNMPLEKFIVYLSQNAKITLETPNDFSKGLFDFESNRSFLDSLLMKYFKR